MYILRILVILLLSAIAAIPTNAQRRKATPQKVNAETEKNTSPTDVLFDNMLEATQQVVIMDSMVVERSDFVRHIPLPKECGTIMEYDKFFGTNNHADSYVYLNELENKIFCSMTDSAGFAQLFSMDKLGENWTEEVPVEGISNKGSANYPFMMPDGTTLYFAQKGENSVGGYDIFVTRYDVESGRFFKPENVGFPFNSKADDLFYIEDELDSLGWFVTDRRQPEGKVCIYTFIPNRVHQNYNLTDYDKVSLRSLAEVESISQTWTSTNERQMALNRLQALKQRLTSEIKSENMLFVINDNLTYTRIDQFRSKSARKMFEQTQANKRQLAEENKKLESLRTTYHEASEAKKSQLAPLILAAESDIENMQREISETERTIRNAENMSINK